MGFVPSSVSGELATSPSSSPPGEDTSQSWKSATWKRTPMRIRACWHLILDLQPPEPREVNSYGLSPPVYGTLLEQPEHTNRRLPGEALPECELIKGED